MNTWLLIAHFSDDTMAVVCHWHRQPTENEKVDAATNYPPCNSAVNFIVVPATMFLNKDNTWREA